MLRLGPWMTSTPCPSASDPSHFAVGAGDGRVEGGGDAQGSGELGDMDGTECQALRPVLEHQRRNAQSGNAGVDVLVDTRIEQDDLTEFLPDRSSSRPPSGPGRRAIRRGPSPTPATGTWRRCQRHRRPTERRPILTTRFPKPGRRAGRGPGSAQPGPPPHWQRPPEPAAVSTLDRNPLGTFRPWRSGLSTDSVTGSSVKPSDDGEARVVAGDRPHRSGVVERDADRRACVTPRAVRGWTPPASCRVVCSMRSSGPGSGSAGWPGWVRRGAGRCGRSHR